MAHAELDAATGITRVQIAWNQNTLVKKIPGARWDATGKTWTVPTSWASLVTLRGVFRDDLTAGEKLTKWAWDYYNNHVVPALELRDSLVPIEDDSPEMQVIRSWRT